MPEIFIIFKQYLSITQARRNKNGKNLSSCFLYGWQIVHKISFCIFRFFFGWAPRMVFLANYDRAENLQNHKKAFGFSWNFCEITQIYQEITFQLNASLVEKSVGN